MKFAAKDTIALLLGVRVNAKNQDFNQFRRSMQIDGSKICDRVESTNCFIDTDKVLIDMETKITPDHLGSQTISSVTISLGAKLSCTGKFCKIAFEGLSHLSIQGTLEASDVYANALKTVEVPYRGLITTSERGHPAGEGPGRGILISEASCSSSHRQLAMTGASHGGHGGFYYSYTDWRNSLYGVEVSPVSFGSGGACTGGAGGGRIYLLAGDAIAVNGKLLANAGSCLNQNIFACTGGSGGAVLLVADEIMGQGIIEAKGGSTAAPVPSVGGGGGRISFHSDKVSFDTLTINVDRGTQEKNNFYTAASPGTVNTVCPEVTCANGGIGECGCKCISGWAGVDCTFCSRHCKNGGILDRESCMCSCPSGWTGLSCEECDSELLCSSHGTCDANQRCTCEKYRHYKSNCSVFCDPSSSCSENGYCNSDGLCECNQGKVGRHCQCDRKQCSGGDSKSSQCSSRGTCSNGVCLCDVSYYGCACETYCTRSASCSGAGECQEDGSCLCDKGFSGTDCSERDVGIYCALGKDGKPNTISGYPCLKGLDNNLGYGFDIINGSRTQPIIQLQFNRGKIFTHDILGVFEIPDNVICNKLDTDSVRAKTDIFKGTYEYRMGMAGEVGVSKVSFKPSFFSTNAQYTEAEEYLFEQQQFVVQNIQILRLYSCRIETFEPQVTLTASRAMEVQSEEQFIRNFGTHVIEEVFLGGFIKVHAEISSCVLATLDETEIIAEVNAAFSEIATAGTYTSSRCGLFNKHSRFNKVIGGGEKSKLIVADSTNPDYLADWAESLHVAPALIRSNVRGLGELFPDFREGIEAHESLENINEININEQLRECLEVARGEASCESAIIGAASAPGSETNTILLGLFYIFSFLLH